MTDEEWEEQRLRAIATALLTGRPVLADSDGKMRYADGTCEEVPDDVGVARQPIPQATVLSCSGRRGRRWARGALVVVAIVGSAGVGLYSWQLAIAWAVWAGWYLADLSRGRKKERHDP